MTSKVNPFSDNGHGFISLPVLAAMEVAVPRVGGFADGKRFGAHVVPGRGWKGRRHVEKSRQML